MEFAYFGVCQFFYGELRGENSKIWIRFRSKCKTKYFFFYIFIKGFQRKAHLCTHVFFTNELGNSIRKISTQTINYLTPNSTRFCLNPSIHRFFERPLGLFPVGFQCTSAFRISAIWFLHHVFKSLNSLCFLKINYPSRFYQLSDLFGSSYMPPFHSLSYTKPQVICR